MQTFDTVLKAAAAQVSLNVLLQCLRAICGRGGGMRCDGARTIHAALPACGALARNLVEQGEPGNHYVVTIMHIIIMIMIMIILILNSTLHTDNNNDNNDDNDNDNTDNGINCVITMIVDSALLL